MDMITTRKQVSFNTKPKKRRRHI